MGKPLGRKKERDLTSTSAPLFFSPEELGKSLSEVAVDVIETEIAAVTSRWFHSKKKDADLFIWLDEDKRIIKHQVSFFGQVVEWNVFDGVRTGIIVESELGPEAARAVSETVRFDSAPVANAILEATRLLEFVAQLSPEERDAMVRNLRESPKASEHHRDEFLRRYAADLSGASRVGWLRRALKWLRPRRS